MRCIWEKLPLRAICVAAGVLRALLGRSEELARSMSLSRLELQVRIELVENQKIFGKCGFIETARNAHPGYDRATEITMQKLLKS